MGHGNPEAVKARLFEVIEKQIRDSDPPETAETLTRLLRAGRTRDEAMKLIGAALVSEVYGVMKSQTPYDNARYVANLTRLPEMPWDRKKPAGSTNKMPG